MATETTRLSAVAREKGHSRSTRRLRREGMVPGVLYGRELAPLTFAANERDLRHALAGHGAVLELDVDGETAPCVLKDAQRHPVRGELIHVDLLRVDLNQSIHAVVTIELLGTDEAPGVIEGGVLEQITREVNIEALPGDIPETIQLDVSTLQINDTVTLDKLVAPEGVTISDEHGEDTVVVTLTPPRLEAELEEIEAETEVVGEGDAEGGADDADADGTGDDAPAQVDGTPE